ncbi:MAG: hypothetical protein NZ551_10675 [Microscillaceae bacterium]|nr:hypothetical protein [Microscillaceae bacterium]MDW8461661.1 hypothetical protein [Cytophagales bacterium]
MPIFTRIAYIISGLFHPLLLPSICFAILFYSVPNIVGHIKSEAKFNLLMLIFLLTFLLPIFSILLIYVLGRISSLTLESQQERNLPYIIASAFYAFSTYFFYTKLGSLAVVYVILGLTTISIILVTIINFFWKISAHSVGIAGVWGFILGLHYRFPTQELLYPLIVVSVVAGLLMTVRLYLDAHTPTQVWIGALLGLCICLGGTVAFL